MLSQINQKREIEKAEEVSSHESQHGQGSHAKNFPQHSSLLIMR